MAKAWQRLGKVGSVAGISWDFTRVLPVFYRLSILYAVYNTILLYIYICVRMISYPIQLELRFYLFDQEPWAATN